MKSDKFSPCDEQICIKNGKKSIKRDFYHAFYRLFIKKILILHHSVRIYRYPPAQEEYATA